MAQQNNLRMASLLFAFISFLEIVAIITQAWPLFVFSYTIDTSYFLLPVLGFLGSYRLFLGHESGRRLLMTVCTLHIGLAILIGVYNIFGSPVFVSEWLKDNDWLIWVWVVGTITLFSSIFFYFQKQGELTIN